MALLDAPVRVVLFPKMETLGGTCLNRQRMSLVLNLCEGQLSGYVQEAAESVSLGLSRVAGTGNH